METEKKTFAIGMLVRERQADYEILNDDGSRTGWIWTFAGPGHPATIAADKRRGQEYLDGEAEIKRTQVNGRKWKGDTPSVDERRADSIAYICERLLGWSEIDMNPGEPFPFTAENAKAVLSNPDLSLYDQANAFLTAEKSFMKRSAKN